MGSANPLISSAQTPKAMEALFQPLVAQILGFDPTGDPDTAFFAVRIGWQQEGQPAWGVAENVCVIMASPEDDPFSRVRDNMYRMTGSPATSLTNEMGYTQVWKMRFVFYGPLGADNARRLVSTMSLDWVDAFLQASNIYAVPVWSRPVRAPELFERLWYERTDVELEFNEQVSESILETPAESVVVTVDTNTGQSETFRIGT